ncbi:cytochrome P450 [Rhodococcus aetherivorans]|uniref:cytochrome P450 n=2 Tax=Rhodococcus aetherivorans TaxID=191292 RepID=UPI003651583B
MTHRQPAPREPWKSPKAEREGSPVRHALFPPSTRFRSRNRKRTSTEVSRVSNPVLPRERSHPMTSTRPTVEFDHHSPEFAADGDRISAELRSRCPVSWTESYDGFWVVASHQGVTESLRDRDRCSTKKTFTADGTPVGGVSIPAPPQPCNIPEETDPPEWDGYRGALNPHFSPTAIRRRRDRIEALTTEVINKVIEKGELDLVMDLANPVTALATLDLLGLPLNTWKFYAEPIHRITYEPYNAEVQAQIGQIFVQLLDIVKERRDNPRQGLIDDMIAVKIDGEHMPDEDLQALFWLMLLGGFDTTATLITGSLFWLDEHPENKQRLLTDDKLLQTATEEFVRWISPVAGLARTAAKDFQVEGQTVTAGERMLMMFRSANYDEKVFDNPEEVDLERFPNRHLGFGTGIHRCLGSHLARTIFQVVLRQVLTRMPDLKIDRAESHKIPDLGVVNSFIAMPATFTPGSRIPSGVCLD